MSATPPPLNVPRGWTTHQVASHLHTLKILFYILGALELLLVPILVLGAAGGYISESNSANPDAQPALLAAIMVGAAAVFAALGSLNIIGARRMAERRSHGLCRIAAGAACLAGALGIALGVYARIVLMRPEVVASFAATDGTVAA
jgi:TRAP-type C4-dicarboxylate transport system permease small subunit